jgi:potassium efflux system protein
MHTLRLHFQQPVAAIARAAFILAALMVALPVHAQSLSERLGITSPASSAKAPAAAPTPEELRKSLKERLAAAQEHLTRYIAAGGEATIPPGLPPELGGERRALLERLVRVYTGHLTSLDELVQLRDSRRTAEANRRDWSGFPKPPPYSVLFVDELRNAVVTAREREGSFNSMLSLAEQGVDRAEQQVERATAAARLAEEALGSARGEDVPRANWQRDTAQLQAEVAGATLSFLGTTRNVAQERHAIAVAERELAERQAATAGAHIQFTEEEFEQIKTNLRKQARGLETELNAAVNARNARLAERTAAQHALDQARQRGASAPQITALEARAERERAIDEALATQIEAMNGALQLGELTRELWTSRYGVATSGDPEARRKALAQLDEWARTLKLWRTYANEKAELAVRKEQAQLALLAAPSLSPADRAAATALHQYLQKARAATEGMARASKSAANVVDRWLDEFEEARRYRTVSERIADGYASLKQLALNVWNFELFVVEETVKVSGQDVTGTRSVTIGKSVGALVILVLGYWLIGYILRRLQRPIARYFGFAEETVVVVRRWTMVAVFLVLLILAFNLVSIPLTVFAFLGGALAIGIGFGTQTLLKNFISGMLMLLERKVRVGDIVEVEGIVGTVTSVDIRASTLRGFDGVESVVPNATFLEQKVTNWTYTTPRVRRAIKVGVAYGSPARRVSEILEECALAHALVLRDPPPHVWFEEFGDSSLHFGLYFWVEVSPRSSTPQIASEIRFMIAERFAGEGITIAFPQHDVHLDTSNPLSVQIVESPNGKT